METKEESKNECYGKSRYHTELIRQLAEVGKASVKEEWFDIVNKFLKTVSKITKAETVSIYQYDGQQGFEQVYRYDSGMKEISGLNPIKLEKNQFSQWIEQFSQQDSVIICDRENMQKTDLLNYERLCKKTIESMIAFRLTHNGQLSGCMILENPEIDCSDTFIELIPLIDVLLGNVRQNHRNEKARKIEQDLLNENKLELERERKFLEVLSRDYTTVYHLDLINSTLEPLKLTEDANATKILSAKNRKKIDYVSHMKLYYGL